jgi:hypothetical protein
LAGGLDGAGAPLSGVAGLAGVGEDMRRPALGLKLFQSIIYSNRNKSVNWYIFTIANKDRFPDIPASLQA